MKPWSLITRLTHWLIAIPVLLDFFIDGGEIEHKVFGYLAFSATLFRLGWGMVAKDLARFSYFPLSTREFWQHGRSLFSRKAINYPGHNPLASWIYLAIWTLVMGLGITGFMMGLDAFWGDEWLENLHEVMSNTLLTLVLLHFLGIAFDSWKFQRQSWKGMFTGDKA